MLTVAARRMRLLATLARARQAGTLDAAEIAKVQSLLGEAQREELSFRTAAAGTLPIDQFTRRLRLRRVDEEMLLAAAAFEIDPLFVLTACALNGEDLRQGLTARVLALLFDLNHDEGLVLQLGANHPLVLAGLLEAPPASQPITAALCPYLAPARTVAFLDGSNELDSALTHIATLVMPPSDLVVAHWAEPLMLVERSLLAAEPVLILIEGAEGAGRRTVAAVAAQRLGRETLSLDVSRLARDRSRLVGELRAFRRECWLRSAVPIFSRFDLLIGDGAGSERLAEVVEAIESSGATLGPIVIVARDGTQLPEFRHRLVRVRIEAPPVGVREQLWASALGGDLADDIAAPLAMLAQRHTLPPGVIRSAAGNARLLAGDRAITVSDVQTGLATEIRERFSGLASRADLGESWDNLVLPQDTLDEVKAFVSRAQNASLVYDRWGFRDKLQRGLGLSALFSGPPGTGKTMVAGLVARTLGLDLYIVDLSQVVSKWVGETEKQLGKIFDAAQMGQALLLFDEADALFAKRTEVKSSNDRYANLEVNYLLQRIEQFSGVAILTTNLETSVDPAFKRRLAADVHFYAPEQAERERLWRTLLPREVPVADDLDFARLAELYPEMCGGHIRNVVLRSAFLAAAEPSSITQALLIRAARTEYRAMGKIAV